jgi:hypothetical protein
MNWVHLKAGLERLRIALFDNSIPEIRAQIRAIVPEYSSDQDIAFDWIPEPFMSAQGSVAAGDD